MAFNYEPGQPLRYYPMAENGTKGFDLATPAKLYQEHQRDLLAQKQAEQMMTLRQQEQANQERHQSVGEQQRALGMRQDEAHAKRRDELYDRQEERRQGEVLFNRQKLTKAEHEQLIHDLYFPPGEPGTPEYVARQQYAAAALQRAGYMPPEPITEDEHPAAAAAPSPSPAIEAPVVVKDTTLGGTLQATDTGAGMRPPKPPSKADAALSGQLDSIDQKYSKGLGVQSGSAQKYIPGKNAMVAKSTAMLDPDDPYNRL